MICSLNYKEELELSPASRSPAGSSRNRCETDGGPGSGRGGCEHCLEPSQFAQNFAGFLTEAALFPEAPGPCKPARGLIQHRLFHQDTSAWEKPRKHQLLCGAECAADEKDAVRLNRGPHGRLCSPSKEE